MAFYMAVLYITVQGKTDIELFIFLLLEGLRRLFLGGGGLRLRLRFIPPHPKKGGAPYRSSKGTALGRDGGPRWFSGAGAYVRVCMWYFSVRTGIRGM